VSRLWRNHSLSITIAVLFLLAWVLQTVLGWGEYVAEQISLGEEPEVFGPTGYLWSWGRATFENWQSEFLQVFVFIVLTTFLIHRHSHESPDTDYDTEAALRRIEARLAKIEGEEHLTAEQVEREHMTSVNVAGHWAYLFGVLAIGFALTIVLLGLIQGMVSG
jgi:Domain of unknown function (DUF6766)